MGAMSGYRLAILSFPPKWPRGPTLSVEVFARELHAAFQELPDVQVDLFNIERYDVWSENYRADVCLVHAYGEYFRQVQPKLARHFTLTSSFMELPFETDLPFVFQGDEGVRITFPSTLPLQAGVVPPFDGGVLLDHWWQAHTDVDTTWTMNLYAALEAMEPRPRVAQLERFAWKDEAIPDWVERVPVLSYEDYLQATSGFRYFVMTHRGSYNATVVDMAARRIHVLAPRFMGLKDHFDCGIATETPSPAAVVDFIREAPLSPPIPTAVTPIAKAVSVMDRHFRERLTS
jgi:hypothetical protein